MCAGPSNWRRLARARLLCVSAAIAATGCQQNVYELELEPQGQQLVRELTVSRSSKTDDDEQLVEFPAAELARIATVYGVPAPAAAAKAYTFRDVFDQAMPADVGGAGWYVHWETSLGTTSAYVERFRGEDDLLAHVEQRQKAVNRLVDLLIAWMDEQFAGDSANVPLRQLLNGPMRRDLTNVSLYAWTHGIASYYSEVTDEALVLRVGQYLIERGYLEPSALPKWARALDDLQHREQASTLIGLVQEMIAVQLGLAEGTSLPPALAALSDENGLLASLNRFLQTTPEYAQLLEEQQAADKPAEAQPAGSEVLVNLLLAALLPNSSILAGGDQLLIKLAAAEPPFFSNGEWADSASRVLWSQQIPASAQGNNIQQRLAEWPNLVFAFWSRANAERQRLHFGRVLLTGPELAQYCLWHEGLSDGEARQWSQFLAQLRPSQDLVGVLESFRFHGEASGDTDEDRKTRAHIAAELLVGALQAEEE